MGLKDVAPILKQGGVGILPTDTLYGLVGSADSEAAVERIYKLKKRRADKPSIILISDIKDLAKFGIKPSPLVKEKLNEWWPGPVSVVLGGVSGKFRYLHRGRGSLAFRLPRAPKLLKLIRQTGPLVAPSANIENQKPAHSITEARKYFGDKIDFYVAGGKLEGGPSALVSLGSDGRMKILRGKL